MSRVQELRFAIIHSEEKEALQAKDCLITTMPIAISRLKKYLEEIVKKTIPAEHWCSIVVGHKELDIGSGGNELD